MEIRIQRFKDSKIQPFDSDQGDKFEPEGWGGISID
jgi:hypothetical protein